MAEERSANAAARIRAAAADFAAATAAVSSDAYESDAQELSQKEVAELVDVLDAVRGRMTALLGALRVPVVRFLGDPAGKDLDETRAHLYASGRQLFELLNKLDPGD